METLAEIDATGFAAAKVVELDSAFATRHTAKFRNYADILYAIIVNNVHPCKDAILSNLVSAVSTPGMPMKVRIWDYSVTYPYLGHVSKREDMARFSEIGHHTVLFDNGEPLSVDAIFRNTDLAWRLAFTFGSKFRVSVVQEENTLVSSNYMGYIMGVYLHYCPEGLPSYAEGRLIRAYKGMCDRPLHVGKNVSMTSRG